MPDDITERYPQLADLDGKDDDQRIEVFRDVLGQLQRELDVALGSAWDDELEPFRHASDDARVVWLHKVG